MRETGTSIHPSCAHFELSWNTFDKKMRQWGKAGLAEHRRGDGDSPLLSPVSSTMQLGGCVKSRTLLTLKECSC